MSLPYLLMLWLAFLADGEGSTWRYVVPSPEDPFAHPPPRVLALSAAKPVGLKEDMRYRGTRQRYAQLMYGTGRSASVIVVLDEVAPNQCDLYVDANRDGTITTAERVSGEGMSWRVPLNAVVPQGNALKEIPRTVQFRYGKASRTLSVATCGYVEGQVMLNGRAVAVRRTDGNADGLLADAQDRVWIDVNGDGRWDAVTEEFLCTPILRLGSQRFALRADAFGERLSLAPLEGTATLKLALSPILKPDQVEDIQVTVQSRDGVVAALRGLDAAVTVPIGEYRVSTLQLKLKDPQAGFSWGFVFGDNGGKTPRWHRLEKDQVLALDPIHPLDFSLSLDGNGDLKPGTALTVRPALYTGDGLLIEKAYRSAFDKPKLLVGEPGWDQPSVECHGAIALVTPDGRTLSTTTSGFA